MESEGGVADANVEAQAEGIAAETSTEAPVEGIDEPSFHDDSDGVEKTED